MTSKERFAQIKDVFIDVVDLPVDLRESAIRDRCSGDEELYREVISLPEYEGGDSVIRLRELAEAKTSSAEMQAMMLGTTTRSDSVLSTITHSVQQSFRERWWRWFAWSTLLQCLLLGLTYLGWKRTEEETTRLVEDNLQTTLRSQSAAIEVWLNDRIEEAESLARYPALIEATLRLRKIGHESENATAALLESPDGQTIRSLLNLYAPDRKSSELAIKKDWDFGIANEVGLVLVSSEDEFVGKRLTAAGRSAMASVYDGETVLVPPNPKDEFVPGYESDIDDPRIWILVPIRQSETEVTALLGIVLRVDQAFSRIVSAGRGGRFIDTYFFNASGVAISNVRHTKQLKNLGVIPLDREERARQPLVLRDPGVNIIEIGSMPEDLAMRPLTEIVQTTIAKREACNVDGYRDYRGVRVAGVGMWLERFGIGAVTEIDRVHIENATSAWRLFSRIQLFCLGITALALVHNRIQRSRAAKNTQYSTIGDYPVIRKLEDGGMGSVYLCSHPRLGRPCAIKILKPDRMTLDACARMKREAQLASTLNHAHTIEIHDFGTTKEGLPYLVMEYVEGETLCEATRDGGMSPERTLKIWRQIVGAVNEAHQRGMLHRDIKPQNIMLCVRGGQHDFAKLLDFGLVKEMESRLDDLITHTVRLMGTPRYMAPERIVSPNLVDVRSDIYGLGVGAYRLLTGRDPFDQHEEKDIFEAIAKHSPPQPSAFSAYKIPPLLDKLVMACLNKRPEDRPKNCEAILNAITKIELSSQSSSTF